MSIRTIFPATKFKKMSLRPLLHTAGPVAAAGWVTSKKKIQNKYPDIWLLFVKNLSTFFQMKYIGKIGKSPKVVIVTLCSSWTFYLTSVF